MKVVLEGCRVDCGYVMWTFNAGINRDSFARLSPMNVIEATAVNVEQLTIANQTQVYELSQLNALSK